MVPYHPSKNKREKLTVTPSNLPLDEKRAQPGDLLLATAVDIHHPAVHYQTVYPAYNVFGIVKQYTYVKLTNKKEKRNGVIIPTPSKD